MRLESHDAPYCESTAVVPLQCEKDNSLRHLAKGQSPSFVAQRFVGVPLRFVAKCFVLIAFCFVPLFYLPVVNQLLL